MSLQTFNFPYHTFETINPETGFRGQFGGAYMFTAPPDAPDVRTFKLGFNGMQFFTNSDNSFNTTTEAKRNMKAMIDFYHAHKLHLSFHYDHPVYGQLEVKFNKPLPEPKGIKNGNGMVEDFEVELVEIP
jgi:hypothetical protein